MTPPEVFALGSGRLTGAMKFLHRKGIINYTNLNANWYTYNSKEVLQRIAFMRGELELPTRILNASMDLDTCSTSPKDAEKLNHLPEFGVFEISSRLVKRSGDFTLHSALVSKRSLKRFRDETDSFEELESDIRKLKEMFQHVILACNIVYDPDLQTVNPHKAKLNNFLLQMDDQFSNVITIDPNKIINSEDPSQDILNLGTFRETFLPKLAELYSSRITTIALL